MKNLLTNYLRSTSCLTDVSGELLQADSYYPFGMTMDGKSYYNTTQYADNKNLYLYNGKELQTDFDLDWYDYGARMYDAQLGRFHTVDRFAEKYSWMTPYQYAGNSPIKNIDINGDSLTDKAQEWADKLHEYAYKKIADLESDKKRYEEKFYSGKMSRKRYDKKTLKADKLKFEYLTADVELYELESSSQWYDFAESSDLGKGTNGRSVMGKVTFDINTGVFMIHALKNSGLGEVAHEFKHAYQFEVGELAFSQNGKGVSKMFNNVYIEREANERAKFFGTSTYTDESGALDKKYINSYKDVLYFRMYHLIFMYDGETYQ